MRFFFYRLSRRWYLVGLSILIMACGFIPHFSSSSIQEPLGVVGNCNLALSETDTPKDLTQISTDLPVAENTPLPFTGKPITPENIKNITRLAIWGRGKLNNLVWSHDGKVLAIASGYGVYLYDAQSHTILRFLHHPVEPIGMAFTTDGQKFITFDKDNVLRFWQVSDGVLLSAFQDEQISGNPQFSTDGKLLAVFSVSNESITVWDISDKPIFLQTFKVDIFSNQMAFTSNGTMLAISNSDTVSLWQLSDGKQINQFSHNAMATTGGVFSTFSPDGELFAAQILADDKLKTSIKVWQVRNGKQVQNIGDLDFLSHTYDMAFNPNGTQLFTLISENNGVIKTWDIQSGKAVYTFNKAIDINTKYAFNPNGELLALIDNDTLRIWQISSDTLIQTLPGNSGFSDVVLNRDETWLAVAELNGFIEFLRMSDGRPICRIYAYHDRVWNLSLNQDSSQLASISFNGEVRLWQTKDGTALHLLSNNFSRHFANFSPDGEYLVTGSQENFLDAWQPNGKTRLFRLNTEGVVDSQSDGRINSLAFSPDGRLWAASGYDYIYVWQMPERQLLHAIRSDSIASVHSMAFSPDGKYLAANSDRGISVWKIEEAQRIFTTDAHKNVVEAIAFSPDGRVIASGSADSTIRLWDAFSGHELVVLPANNIEISKILFTADGSKLISVGLDGVIMVWGIR